MLWFYLAVMLLGEEIYVIKGDNPLICVLLVEIKGGYPLYWLRLREVTHICSFEK